MVTNTQIANTTQSSSRCRPQSVRRNIDSIDDFIPADHFKTFYRKKHPTMMDQAEEEASWLTDTDGKVASEPGKAEAEWPVPMYASHY